MKIRPVFTIQEIKDISQALKMADLSGSAPLVERLDLLLFKYGHYEQRQYIAHAPIPVLAPMPAKLDPLQEYKKYHSVADAIAGIGRAAVNEAIRKKSEKGSETLSREEISILGNFFLGN